MRLILVRHGSTEWNESGRRQGHQDVPLSELGRWQVQALSARLMSVPIDAVYSSDLSRATETARVIIGERDLAIQVDQRLREVCFGRWEGLNHEEIEAQFPREWQRWLESPVEARPPEGESFSDLAIRVWRAIGDLVGDGLRTGALNAVPREWPLTAVVADPRSVLVVTHGAAIAVLLTQLLGQELSRYWQYSIRPASLTILDLYPLGAIAAVIGDTGHVEAGTRFAAPV